MLSVRLVRSNGYRQAKMPSVHNVDALPHGMKAAWEGNADERVVIRKHNWHELRAC